MSTRRPWACPRDGKTLGTARAADLDGHRCYHCAGVFLSRSVLRAGHAGLDGRLEQALTQPEPPEAESLPCPQCACTMRALLLQGVTLDLCPACHGLWLDRGELETLLGLPPRLRLELEEAAGSRRSRAAAQADTEQRRAEVAEAGVDVADAVLGSDFWPDTGAVVDGVFDLLGGVLDGISS